MAHGFNLRMWMCTSQVLDVDGDFLLALWHGKYEDLQASLQQGFRGLGCLGCQGLQQGFEIEDLGFRGLEEWFRGPPSHSATPRVCSGARNIWSLDRSRVRVYGSGDARIAFETP